jgi:DNA (cytosine-5)-methyltransferase 1
MKYGSVCSGIEAATSAWHSLGWTPTWFSEIEPFPCAVLAHHYPNVPNFGDMTKFKEWKIDDTTAIDVLVGGTPCQSFSVAGLRKGLDDPRGNLMLTYLAIAAKYQPRWLVWENVPGVLSSNGGKDFGTFLGALGELGYGFAYRILDAQFFGVPQRRRRVFVVGCLGDWRGAAAVLFERHSLSGNPAPSRKAGEKIAKIFTQCFDRQSSGEYGTAPIASTISARDYKSASDLIAEPVIIHGVAQSFALSEVGPTMGSSGPPYSRTGNERVETEALAITNMAVRRLTPVECEALQGFPKNYTNIPWRKKDESPDGPRYKALGNSMAVPVMKWIGERIQMINELEQSWNTN